MAEQLTTSDRRDSLRLRVIVTVLVLLALLAFTAKASMSAFNAQTKNTGTFSSGTLVLSDQKGAATACLSTGGGTTDTNSATCDALAAFPTSKPGDTASTSLTIENVGSLNASAFKVFSSACTNGDAAGETYHGTGNICDVTQLTIQQYSDSGFSTPTNCLYGGGTATTCDWTDATKTLSAFASTYSSGAPLTIGTGLAKNTPAYVKVSVQFPSTAGNAYQGRTGTLDLTWQIDQ